MTRSRKTARVAGLLVSGLALCAVAACVPRVETRGHLPDPELVAEIEPGETSRDEVEEILGSPSHIAVFGGETWFYISKRTETEAFFAPELKDRKVLVLKFDKEGNLIKKASLKAEDGHIVDPVDRETPTAGNDFTILDQLLGNLGRFGAPE